MYGMNTGHQEDKELLEKIERGELKPDPGEQYTKYDPPKLDKDFSKSKNV